MVQRKCHRNEGKTLDPSRNELTRQREETAEYGFNEIFTFKLQLPVIYGWDRRKLDNTLVSGLS